MTFDSKLIDVCFNLSAQRFIGKTIYKSHMYLSWSAIFSVIVYFPYVKLLVWKVTGSNLWQNLFHQNVFYFGGNISFNGNYFFHKDFYTSFKQTVHPSDFENKLLPSQWTFSYRQGTNKG